MIKYLPRNIFRFIIIVAAQILIFNNIQLSEYLNPYIYILFILMLPFETPRWLLLVTGFLLGITIDLFSHTIGMHASATVLIAFMRPAILQIMAPRDGYEILSLPRLSHYGFRWFFYYALLMTFIHHFVLFYIEIFSFDDFFRTLFRVILSTLFSLFIIIISQYIFFRR